MRSRLLPRQCSNIVTPGHRSCYQNSALLSAAWQYKWPVLGPRLPNTPPSPDAFGSADNPVIQSGSRAQFLKSQRKCIRKPKTSLPLTSSVFSRVPRSDNRLEIERIGRRGSRHLHGHRYPERGQAFVCHGCCRRSLHDAIR